MKTNITAYRNRDLSVVFNANLASNKNRITKLNPSIEDYNKHIRENNKTENGGRGGSLPPILYYVGASTTAIYAVPSLGIDPATGVELYRKKDGTITKEWNQDDMQVCGDLNPDIQGTFGVNVAYKGFYLNTTFKYALGGQIYNHTLVSKVENAKIKDENVDRRILTERWRKVGDVSAFYVAVKVLRPGMLKVIDQDLALIHMLAGWVERLFADGKRLRPREVAEEFDKYLHDELDLTREAASAAQLRRNMAGLDLVLVPEMFWDYIRDNVLVMERMSGIPISQTQRLREAGVDIHQLARDGVTIFFTQVFRDGFFHADMHPGNIMVSVAPGTFGRYISLDFGIVGTLTEYDKEYLAQNFTAFFRRDYKRVAELHVESGWVPADTRIDELEAAIRSVCEPYFDRPLKEISLGMVLMRLFQTSRRFNVVIQPQLVLLQKTLLNIEGLGRQLDPDLDLWSTAKPFLERWMNEQIGPRRLLRELKDMVQKEYNMEP